MTGGTSVTRNPQVCPLTCLPDYPSTCPLPSRIDDPLRSEVVDLPHYGSTTSGTKVSVERRTET